MCRLVDSSSLEVVGELPLYVYRENREVWLSPRCISKRIALGILRFPSIGGQDHCT